MAVLTAHRNARLVVLPIVQVRLVQADVRAALPLAAVPVPARAVRPVVRAVPTRVRNLVAVGAQANVPVDALLNVETVVTVGVMEIARFLVEARAMAYVRPSVSQIVSDTRMRHLVQEHALDCVLRIAIKHARIIAIQEQRTTLFEVWVID